MFSHHASHLVQHHDEEKWPHLCNLSKMQSPIALSSRFAYKKHIKPIKLDNFDGCERAKVKNTGHTVMVFPTTCHCRKPKLSGGLLTQNYIMDHVHFHWPSEHTIDGLWYDLEAHFVFRAEKYKSLEDAVKFPFGLTVMAILLAETTCTASKNFTAIGDAVKLVATKPQALITTTEKIKYHEFLPYDHRDYFAYEGSLTTPNCAEFVNWIVYKRHANIALLDYNNLTSIYNAKNELQTTNNRPPQPLYDRIVYMPDLENRAK